jgi:hypothetical protein
MDALVKSQFEEGKIAEEWVLDWPIKIAAPCTNGGFEKVST